MRLSVLIICLMVFIACENRLTYKKEIIDISEPHRIQITPNFIRNENAGETKDDERFEDTSLYLTVYYSNFEVELSQEAEWMVGHIFYTNVLHSMVFTHERPESRLQEYPVYFDYGEITLSDQLMERYYDEWNTSEIYLFGLYYKAKTFQSLEIPFDGELEFVSANSPHMKDNQATIPVNPVDMLENRFEITNLDNSKEYSMNNDLTIKLSRDLPENNYFNFIIAYIDELGMQSYAVHQLNPEVLSDLYLIESNDLKRLKSEAISFIKDPNNWDRYGTGSPVSSFDEANLVYYIKTGKTWDPANRSYSFKTEDLQDNEYDIAVILNYGFRHQIKFVD